MLENSNFTIDERGWESEFFRKRWGYLAFSKFLPSRLIESPSLVEEDLTAIIEESNDLFELLEVSVEAEAFTLVPYLEDVGFRLVDSRITFKTVFTSDIAKSQNFPLDFPFLRIEEFSNKYLEQIISLTKKHLTNNPSFISRYKNPLFMESGSADNYFTLWVSNALISNDSMSCVLLDTENMVQGYFIYQRKNSEEELPVYKGILTVINDAYRGKATHLVMQSFLFSKIKDKKYVIDNTTQLSNLPVIRNHIKSQRRLNSISLTFFRKNIQVK